MAGIWADLVHSGTWLVGGLLFVVLFAYWCAPHAPLALAQCPQHPAPSRAALTRQLCAGPVPVSVNTPRVKFLEDNLSPSVRQRRREEATAKATGKAHAAGLTQRKPSAA